MFIYILLFISGISLGSFYNVVGLRLLENKSIVYPPSHCPNCKNRLKWYELIPVFSFIFLRGKCFHCKQKISIIYPLFELLTGILFCFSYYKFGFSFEFLNSLVISSILVIIYLTDFKEYIILDEVLFFGGLSLLVLSIVDKGLLNTLYSSLSALGLFIVFYLIKIFGDKVFKRESLGGGDIKLSLLIGFVLGFKLGLACIFVASFLAFPIAVMVLLYKKVKEIPYGPFLITSLLIIYFMIDFFNEVFLRLFEV